ncbi:hypothetical protein BIU82_07315 [Arthrobacter sp. SW1]|nr:hypothetical protein BIU82_07315 [Arthrobacter sp. SW1]
MSLLALLIAGCSPLASAPKQTTSSASTSQSPSVSATPSEASIELTSCPKEKAAETQGNTSYICTKDRAGLLVWMEAADSKKLTDERTAAALLAAKKAAEQKAAAEKLAAQKAAAQKAAAERAAAEKAAAEQAAAEKRAAEEAAAQAAAEAAAQQQAAQSNCDPNYAGDCVPIASDVDCASGSGNGPAYVQGPVTVVGSDIYRLDGDHDGIGCE